MTDGAFPDRLAQLKGRWESDPSSRVFLQLAEEYRHQGRVKEALSVLDRGLREHPGYLSALVAKGRCHLELGEPEPARTVLERVVKQDATQMVANKLLVRAYLDTGEPEKARERLDLYSLLNDSDPEIEELRRRLRAMERPPQAPPTSDPFPEAGPPRRAAPPQPPRREASDDIFDLGPAAPAAPARRVEEDLFALDVPAPQPASVTIAAVAVAAPSGPEEEPEAADILFPGLASRESRRRYLRALSSEGLFFLDLTPAEPVVAAPVEEAPVFDLEERTPWTAEPEPIAPEPVREETVEAEPVATATLGDLYLRQGHHGEAEQIFREVLRREPDNAAARQGLAQVPVERRPLHGRDLLAGYEPGEEGGEMEVKARRAFLLNSYLKRLRRGGQHVS
ncbi:MAG TPA: tetratricopeptide repeat protein [Thermoanaerobaculia bacterium]|jgi:tetratricopeptide (TPR) repeat protein